MAVEQSESLADGLTLRRASRHCGMGLGRQPLYRSAGAGLAVAASTTSPDSVKRDVSSTPKTVVLKYHSLAFWCVETRQLLGTSASRLSWIYRKGSRRRKKCK